MKKLSQFPNKRIKSLPSVLVDKIAAGEVIDAPYSVIKELVENSIDAGAQKIRIETETSGMEKIIINDDGAGIHFEDLPKSTERHATSKISKTEDIEKILSFGFRGEALAAIAAVSHFAIQSGCYGEDLGGLYESRGGEMLRHEHIAWSKGTTISVRELFYAVPARKKYIKSPKKENLSIQREIVKLALAHPEIHFIYYRDGREFFDLPAVQKLEERIEKIFQTKITGHLIEIEAEMANLRLHGFITNENYYRANRDGQFQFINQRHVEIKHCSYLVKKAYDNLLPTSAHPYYFLFFEIDPERIDVNVHPAKKEVRLKDTKTINSLILRAVSDALRSGEPISFSRQTNSLEFSTNFNTEEKPTGKQIEAFEPEKLIKSSKYRSVQIKTENEDEINEANPEKSNNFLPRRHFGIIFGTYILAEDDDSFYLIDQHTAHERINYEHFRKTLKMQKEKRQILLSPVSISCTSDELEAVLAKKELLLNSGFLIEEFGPNTYAVREIPAYLEPGTEMEILIHAVERILEGADGVDIYDELAAMKACRASIKSNDNIAPESISDILIQLSRCEDPARCPHGRPTMIKISRTDIDRMFKRI